MTSEATPRQHQQSSGTLSLDDVSKLFSLPIAEAAQILGVCTSVLKRICRTNGIIRWPYRKFLAGKTVEDIKKDAAREKSAKLTELSKIAKQKIEGSNKMPSTSVVSSSTFRSFGLTAQETPKYQAGDSTAGYVLQSQGNSSIQYKWSNMAQSNQTKHIPTYMDEFKYGFPTKGLSSTSTKWWGNNGESMEKESSADHNNSGAEPSTTLSSLRKRALLECRAKSLKGCGGSHHKLGSRQSQMLLQVFNSSLPDQWKDMLS